MRTSLLGILFFSLLFQGVTAQKYYSPDTIRLLNPSFEGYPVSSHPPQGWWDCGFPGETAPDVQPFRATTSAQWGQSNKLDSVTKILAANDGKTYLGMVVRDNDTWERVSQRLVRPLEADKCYAFSIDLCRSQLYVSQSRKTGQMVSYNEPAVLRVWGGTGMCTRVELLAESDAVDNITWQNVSFEIRPSKTYRFIMLEAFYKTPVLIPYNGNILVDNLSEIKRIQCPDEEILEEVVEVEEPSELKTETVGVVVKEVENSEIVLNPPKEKILVELEREKVKVGQTIRIKTLQFDTDSSTIKEDAFSVLDEIAYFLIQNPDVKVEIGGHTSRPMNKKDADTSKKYFEQLSLNRSKAVAHYLYKRGILKDQLTYKGYGFTKPVASNYSSVGKLKNQRVEIKIMELRNLN